MACWRKKPAISKSLVFLFCNGFLVYQLLILTKEYLQFKTVISIERRPQSLEKALIPAISVCRRERAFSDKHIATIYGDKPCDVFEGETQRTNVECAQNAATALPLKRWFEMSTKYTGFAPALRALRDDSADVLQIKNGNYECLTHLSQLDSKRTKEELEDPFETANVAMDTIAQFATLATVFVGNFTPVGLVEPSVYIQYSDLSDSSINNTIETEEFIKNEAVDWIPVFVELHPSKSMPSLIQQGSLSNNYLRNTLSKKHLYQLVFTWDRIERLEAPFDTECQRYHDNETKSYCYWRCDREAYLKHCGCVNLAMTPAIKSLDGERFEADHDVACSQPHEFDHVVSRECANRCQTECSEIVYYYELVDVTDKSTLNALLTSRSQVLAEFELIAKLQSEIVYWHLSRMDLIAYSGNVGGLFSLWLGLSIYAVYDYGVGVYNWFQQKTTKIKEFASVSSRSAKVSVQTNKKKAKYVKEEKSRTSKVSKVEKENEVEEKINALDYELPQLLAVVTARPQRLQ